MLREKKSRETGLLGEKRGRETGGQRRAFEARIIASLITHASVAGPRSAASHHAARAAKFERVRPVCSALRASRRACSPSSVGHTRSLACLLSLPARGAAIQCILHSCPQPSVAGRLFRAVQHHSTMENCGESEHASGEGAAKTSLPAAALPFVPTTPGHSAPSHAPLASPLPLSALQGSLVNEGAAESSPVRESEKGIWQPRPASLRPQLMSAQGRPLLGEPALSEAMRPRAAPPSYALSWSASLGPGPIPLPG